MPRLVATKQSNKADNAGSNNKLKNRTSTNARFGNRSFKYLTE